MTTMLFYDKIVPLNRDRHRKLRLKTAGGRANFAAGTHYVPLAGAEFHQAARDYPVLFAGGEDDAGGPVALLGLREQENLFVDGDGTWSAGTYVPAFVRRYPFILAKGEEGGKYTVCIDESYDGFSEDEGTPLFDDEGKDTEVLTKSIDFLNRLLAEMDRTEQFVARLKALDLLMRKDLRITDNRSRNFLLRDFRIVDEEKLAKLDDSVLGELHRSGFLGWIYAHLISLGNTSRLPARVGVDDAAQPAAEDADFKVSEQAEDEKASIH